VRWTVGPQRFRHRRSVDPAAVRPDPDLCGALRHSGAVSVTAAGTLRRPRVQPLPGGGVAALLATVAVLAACAHPPLATESLVVTATAYNSLPGQGSGDPSLAAWGDRLEPGMRAIAVSRDLLALGLGHRTRVRIEGLRGEYEVLDKLAARWQRRIDIYMGNDREAALRWGKRKVRITWSPDRAGSGEVPSVAAELLDSELLARDGPR
jgi:3D (Asp-Asp-Asp) domain-containing protein